MFQINIGSYIRTLFPKWVNRGISSTVYFKNQFHWLNETRQSKQFKSTITYEQVLSILIVIYYFNGAGNNSPMESLLNLGKLR